MNTIFRFSTEQEMTEFLRYEIPSAYKPSSGYCRQDTLNGKLFNCLFNYPYNVPKTSYTITFRYSKNGENGYLPVFIDVTKNKIILRSLN